MGTLSRKVAQGQATRGALLAAARVEFAARGYTDASLDGIVCRARMTKGAFYHHFTGKQDLFLRVFENVKKELSRGAFVVHLEHRPFAAPEAQPETYKPLAEQTDAEVWRQLIDRCRRYIELHTDPEVSRIVLVDARSVLDWKDWHRVEREHGVVLLRADLRRAMQRRILRRLPLGTLAVILTGALNDACLLVANAPDRAAALDEAMTVLAGLLEGLRAGDAAGAA